MTLDADQMKELCEIFKNEAFGHIKAVAKILIQLADEGTDNAVVKLSKAYGEMHGIKGSANTIGARRIFLLSERLEEALHAITREQLELSYQDVDLLLEGLDAVRCAVDDLGNDVLEPEKVFPKDEIVLNNLQDFINSVHLRSASDQTRSVSEIEPSEKEIVSNISGVPSRSSGAPGKSGLPFRTTRTSNVGSTSVRGGIRISSKPATPRISVTPSSHRELDIPKDQLQYLVSVFQTEAAEHIKSLAEMLFNLEDGQGDISQILVNAFRQAHSLKGSAGTIGFDRVATVTHALEDALGALQKNQKKISPEITDVLLDTLEIIRHSVKESQIGESKLSEKESESAAKCRKIAADLSNVIQEEALRNVKSKSLLPSPPDKEEVESKKIETKQEKVEPESAPAAPSAASTKDEFIRVSEDSIENLIGHIGELFEAHLHLSSVNNDLERLDVGAENVCRLIQGWADRKTSSQNQHLLVKGELESILDAVRALKAQAALAAKRFKRDEREFSKLIQVSRDALQKIRLAPVSTIFVMIRRQVREICRVTNKRVELFLDGGEYAVDRKVLEAIEDPLIHLIRNAVDHGIEDSETRLQVGKSERGKLSVIARHVGDAVELVISDDGKGIDPEKIRETIRKKNMMKPADIDNLTKDQLLDFLFESGFTTTSGVSKISGRGVGLDVVKFTMERLGGEVRIGGKLGLGTTFTLRLPLSMSTLRCLLVRVSGRIMAIPASNVDKVILLNPSTIQNVGGGETVVYNKQSIALSKMSNLLHLTEVPRPKNEMRVIVIVSFGERRVAFDVDDIVEYTQLILRPLGDLLERVSYVSGVSLLGSGEVALVLNPSDLVRSGGGQKGLSATTKMAGKVSKSAASILVVDDSMTTRTLEKSLLEAAGYNVMTAQDGYQALDIVSSKRCDLVVSDIQMPNMDGLTLARTIKSQYRYLKIPVILVSSLGSDEDKMRGMESGADAYIVKKDLSQKELISTIEQLLG